MGWCGVLFLFFSFHFIFEDVSLCALACLVDMMTRRSQKKIWFSVLWYDKGIKWSHHCQSHGSTCTVQFYRWFVWIGLNDFFSSHFPCQHLPIYFWLVYNRIDKNTQIATASWLLSRNSHFFLNFIYEMLCCHKYAHTDVIYHRILPFDKLLQAKRKRCAHNGEKRKMCHQRTSHFVNFEMYLFTLLLY